MNSFVTSLADGRKIDDRLSPILVKELRQGMRARAFVLTFLLIQVFLIVLVLGNIAAQNDRSTLETQNGFFWVIVGFALLVLMPFRGLAAISNEIRHNTIETILLTRMTAWRIVFGKWSALFAQSLLFVSAVLPYVVLRYFIGGQDIVSDFAWLFFLLWLSGMMIAAAITVSALANAVVRIILVVVAAPTFLTLFESSMYGSGLSRVDFWEIIGALAIAGFFIPALLFELTASTIAPVSENHAIRRRLLALLFFVAASLLCWSSGNHSSYITLVPLGILCGICYYELSEKIRLLPRLVKPLHRFGIPGKVVGIFFLPGWPSALLFSLLFIPLAIVVNALICPQLYTSLDGLAVFMTIFAVFGSVLVPITICHLVWPKMKQVLLIVVLYNVVLSVVASLLDGFSSLTHSNIFEVLALTPSLSVLTSNIISGTHRDSLTWFVFGNLITLITTLVVLFAGSRTYFRELFVLLRSTKNPATDADKTEGPLLTP